MSGNLKTECGNQIRGQASKERSAMEKRKVIDKPKYRALSEVIHCQNTKTKCPKSTTAKKYLPKKKNKKK